MSAATRALVPTLVPNQTLVRQIAIVLGGAAITALAAQASLPWYPVPLTLQTLAVTLCGITMGARLAVMSQIAYIGAGMAGLPVFANGGFGAHHLLGPTGGYLAAFVLAAGLLGWLADKGWDRKLSTAAIALAVGNLLILAMGTAWLAVWSNGGWDKAFALGFTPFISGAIAKSVVVIVAMPLTWRLVGKDRTSGR